MSFQIVSDIQNICEVDWYVIQEKQLSSSDINRQKASIIKDEIIGDKISKGFLSEYIIEILEYLCTEKTISSVLFFPFVDPSDGNTNKALFETEKEVLSKASSRYSFDIILFYKRDSDAMFNQILNMLGDNLNHLLKKLSVLEQKICGSSHMTISEYASSETLRLLKTIRPKQQYENDYLPSYWNEKDVFKFMDDIKAILFHIEETARETGTLQDDLLRELGADRTRKSKWKKDPAMEAISLSRLLVSECPSIDEYDDIVRHWVDYQFPAILIGRNLLLAREQETNNHYVWDDDTLDRLNELLFDYQIYNQKTGPQGIGDVFSDKLFKLISDNKISIQEVCKTLNCSTKELQLLLIGADFEDKKRYLELYLAFVNNYGIDKDQMKSKQYNEEGFTID